MNTFYGFISGTKTIWCHVLSEPPANFSWYRSVQQITEELKLGFEQSSITVRRDLLKAHLISSTKKSIFTPQVHIHNATVFGGYKCKAENSIGSIERVFNLRPGRKPDTPLIHHMPIATHNGHAVDNGPPSIYINLSLPKRSTPQQITEMDATGFRVQFILVESFKLAIKTWTNADFVDFEYQIGEAPYVLRNMTWNENFLVRAATKNVAGFSDYSEPLTVNLPSLPVGETSGYPPLLNSLTNVILRSIIAVAIKSTFINQLFRLSYKPHN